MKKIKVILTDPKDYLFFEDREFPNRFYAMLKSDVKAKNKIMFKFGRKEEDVPDKYTIKAFILEKVGEENSNTDKIDIVQKEPIDFPINKIKWNLIKYP